MKTVYRVQKSITVKPQYFDPTFCIFHDFIQFRLVLVKCHLRTFNLHICNE